MVVMFLDPDEEEAEESGGSVSLNDREVQKAIQKAKRDAAEEAEARAQRRFAAEEVRHKQVVESMKSKVSALEHALDEAKTQGGQMDAGAGGMISEEVLQQEVAERVATMQSSFEGCARGVRRNHAEAMQAMHLRQNELSEEQAESRGPNS